MGELQRISWQEQFIADMREIGLLAEVCMGCGKVDCGGCPCGTTTSVIHSKLSLEASTQLKAIHTSRAEP